jgi:glycolate oxidase subunit GlcD
VSGLVADLARVVGREAVRAPQAVDLADATEAQALRGHAEAVVLPGTPQDVAAVVAFCHEHRVAITPRGGGTGLAGGAVPQGGVVLALERLAGVRRLDAAQWRMEVAAGTTTATVARVAREHGLRFPPDPGAIEQSQIGGNLATNAGGPHAFRHGVVGRWVLGLEAVLCPGEVVTVGGPVRKDVAGLDLKALLVGSEGTLGIITGAWLRLVPAPEVQRPLLALFPDVATGCAAVDAVLASGLQPAILEVLDGRTLAAAPPPAALPAGAGFAVLVEAEGAAAAVERELADLREALEPGATAMHAPEGRAALDELWRWRAGLTYAAIAQHGGKVSEDVAVPVEHLRAMVEGTLEIGARHSLDACSWGHGGDGNLHATFLLDREDPEALARAGAAAREVVELALRLGGTASGEHGAGLLKRDVVAAATPPRLRELQLAVKAAFDPHGILNPGKKLQRSGSGQTTF